MSQKKYAVFTDTLCQGTIPCGMVHDENGMISWLVFDTEREAQLDIIDDIEEHIRQFRNEEREFNEIAFDDLFVVEVDLHEDGALSTADYGNFPPPPL